jgi:hypothetical protein
MAASPHNPQATRGDRLAQHRPGELLGKLRRPDSPRAVGEALTSRSFDELIISTLTQRGSRRLGIDLPPIGSTATGY